MEIFVSPKAQVYIMCNNGELRKPEISEVELADSVRKKTIQFSGPVGDEKLKKCRCDDDEIILEKMKDGKILISTAYQADKSLYTFITELAFAFNCDLEIKKCERLGDMYVLDKTVEAYKEFKEKT